MSQRVISLPRAHALAAEAQRGDGNRRSRDIADYVIAGNAVVDAARRGISAIRR